jgi:hypothetical protein
MRPPRLTSLALAAACAAALTGVLPLGTGPVREALAAEAPDPLADASPLEGCWDMTLALPRGMSIAGKLALHVDGEKLTGSLAGPGGRSMPLLDGEVNGEKLSFSLKGPGRKIKLRGTQRGDELSGEADGPGGGKLPWSAKRCQ